MLLSIQLEMGMSIECLSILIFLARSSIIVEDSKTLKEKT